MTQVLERPEAAKRTPEAPKPVPVDGLAAGLVLRATYPLWRLGIKSKAAALIILAVLVMSAATGATIGLMYAAQAII